MNTLSLSNEYLSLAAISFSSSVFRLGSIRLSFLMANFQLCFVIIICLITSNVMQEKVEHLEELLIPSHHCLFASRSTFSLHNSWDYFRVYWDSQGKLFFTPKN